jgi:hypothetical protein
LHQLEKVATRNARNQTFHNNDMMSPREEEEKGKAISKHVNFESKRNVKQTTIFL